MSTVNSIPKDHKSELNRMIIDSLSIKPEITLKEVCADIITTMHYELLDNNKCPKEYYLEIKDYVKSSFNYHKRKGSKKSKSQNIAF